ncbi:MAG: YggS family pyridoxal phosphate-dependent enzyme [Nitrospira sp.]|nr:YggS family pyridoxal phosphate-dependent enzyme [Nitrospira sp.]
MSIAERLKDIENRIADAAGRVGRNPEEITLVAVSKGFSIDRIREAIEAGVRIFGENKVQELLPKIEGAGRDISWHFIGHLQSNKAKYITGEVTLIHSIDSLKLCEEVNQVAQKRKIIQDILLEVNVSGEKSKFGISPDEVINNVTAISKLENVVLKGLMTIAPYSENPEESRPHFRKLREIRDEIKQAGICSHDFGGLSMGMSNDFEVGIEEGATIVRVGSAIFGERL